MLTERLSAEPTTVAITLSMVLLLILLSDRFSHNIKSTEAELPIANRAFYFEPRVFAKFRWAFNARDILDRAYEKARALRSFIRSILKYLSLMDACIASIEETLN